MAVWASVDDVRARVSYATIGATSKPTEDEVLAWLNEAEARVRGILAAQGLATTYDGGSDAELILRGAVVDFAEGHCLNTWGAGDGNVTGRPGDALLAKFETFLGDLRARTVQLGSELAGGDVAETSRGVRSYWTDNDDGLSIAGGDFEPVIGSSWKD